MNAIQCYSKNTFYIPNNKQIQKSLSKSFDVKNLASFNSVPFFAYKSLYCPNISFKGSVKEKNTIDYSNREEYLDYMDNKIKTAMHNRTEDEIKAMIEEIAKDNQVDTKTVQEVMARVVQFTSYTQLPNLFSEMKICGVNRFSALETANYPDLNNVFNYVGWKKCQIIPQDSKEDKKRIDGLILDERTLEHIKQLKDGLNIEEFDFLKKAIKYNCLKFFVIDGWHTKINGKDMAYTAFGSPNDLKTVVDSIVKEQKKTGKSLDEIMNADTIKQAKEIFGDDIEVNVIKNPITKNADVKSIAKCLYHKAPTKDYMNALLQLLSFYSIDKNEFSAEERDLYAQLVSEYYDKALCIYSPESLNNEMKTLYSKIEKIVTDMGKTMQDVVYFIPEADKSFEAINYQYAKVNNVPIEQYVFNDGNLYNSNSNGRVNNVDLTDKVVVVLDDFAGSGDSLVDTQFYFLDYMENEPQKPIIIASVCALADADELIRRTIRQNGFQNAHFVTNKVFNYGNDFIDKLSPEKRNLYNKLFMLGTDLMQSGYRNGHACVSFPYMRPDNNSAYSSVLLNYINNKKSYPQTISSAVFNRICDLMSK